jgi:hypothetical protein
MTQVSTYSDIISKYKLESLKEGRSKYVGELIYNLTKLSKETRLKFKLRIYNDGKLKYKGKNSADIYLYRNSKDADDWIGGFRKWYHISQLSGVLKVEREIAGQLEHLSIHDLAVDRSSFTYGFPKRLYNLHFSNKNKFSLQSTFSNQEDASVINIVKSGRKYGLPKRKNIFEQISLLQNFDSNRFSAKAYNDVISSLNPSDIDKIRLVRFLKENKELRKKLYQNKTEYQIKHFEEIFGDESSFEKSIVERASQNSKYFEIGDTRYVWRVSLSNVYDPESAINGYKNMLIEMGLCNKNTGNFLFFGHIKSPTINSDILVGIQK